MGSPQVRQQPTTTSNSSHVSVLNDLIAHRMQDILEELEVDYSHDSRMIKGVCPVHGGDNTTALNYYKDGHTIAGYWVCNTRNCQREFKATALGFLWGVLSHKELGWSAKGDKKISFSDVIKWACDFLGVNLEDLTPKMINKSNIAFIKQMDSISQNIIRNSDGIPRDIVRKNLKFPAQFYIDRAYKKETLDFFDVGFCDNPEKKLYNRVVVPVYDDSKRAVCLTARTTRINDNIKWMNYPEKCEIGNYLYNMNNALKHINERKSIVLVEGPGDVWRLWEAGCYNCVAIFGTALKERQQILIEKTSAMTIYLMLDNDIAGRNGVDEIKKDLSNLYNIRVPEFSGHDVGELDVNVLREILIKEKIL